MSLIEAYTDAFFEIFQSRRLTSPPAWPVTELTLQDAYDVQRRVIERRVHLGEEVVGYKVGCTSRAIRQQFGLTEPICGHLTRPYVYSPEMPFSCRDFVNPAIEPEFVLTIARDLTDEVGPQEALQGTVEFVSPGIELHHYRWWCGEPSLPELICSNGIHAGLVIGAPLLSPGRFCWEMEGVGVFNRGELIASGISADIMGSPMNSLRWLINHLVRRGTPLRAGQLVIPGSATRLLPVEPGDQICARFTHIGEVTAEFTA